MPPSVNERCKKTCRMREGTLDILTLTLTLKGILQLKVVHN